MPVICANLCGQALKCNSNSCNKLQTPDDRQYEINVNAQPLHRSTQCILGVNITDSHNIIGQYSIGIYECSQNQRSCHYVPPPGIKATFQMTEFLQRHACCQLPHIWNNFLDFVAMIELVPYFIISLLQLKNTTCVLLTCRYHLYMSHN